MTRAKIKGVIFISDVTKALEHEWFVEFTNKNEFDLEFVLFNSDRSDLFQFIKNHKFPVKNYPLPSKYFIPFYVLYFGVKLLLSRPHFVHCHLFQASIIGVLASTFSGIKKRIYTRHHADVHLVNYPSAVKYDRLLNRLSTHIIAVSMIVRAIMIEQEQAPSDKISVIPHGIPLKLFDPKTSASEINAMKKKYDLEGKYPIIGVVSRFVPWKGVEYIIPAFSRLLLDFPNSKLVLANAGGLSEKEIRSLLETLPPDSYTSIKFEPDMVPLFKTFNVFVHVPVDITCEAFGQVYIEALNLGVPMVCTRSGIAIDIIRHEENALVADFRNSDTIYLNLVKMLKDEDLRNRIIKNGKTALLGFTFENKFEKIKTLYLS